MTNSTPPNGGKQAAAQPWLALREKAEALRDSVPPNSKAAKLAQEQIDFIDEQLRRLEARRSGTETTPLDRAELERRRDQEALAAETLIYGTSRAEGDCAGLMSAASAHATLAAYYQARIEWEHGVGY